ncbi:MAG TPA: hypothetical protein VF610_01380 [Segetibacter sp.]|jgi:hypothetical protein
MLILRLVTKKENSFHSMFFWGPAIVILMKHPCYAQFNGIAFIEQCGILTNAFYKLANI